MKIKHLVVAALVGLTALVSCGPVAYIEKDPAANLATYNTFAWVETRSNQDNNGQSTTSFASLSVQNAVNEQLKQKGLTMTDNNPDLLISYDLLVQRDVETRNDPLYTQPLVRYFYNPYFSRWSSLYYPSRFVGYDSYSVPVNEATLTISMMDTKTDKTVWQGWASQNVNSGRPSPEEIREKVQSILRKFKR